MLAIQYIHPIVVHFPIVLIILLAGFDLIAALRGAAISGRTTAGHIAASFAVLAGLSALTAAFFGDIALEHAEAGGFSSGIAEIHEHFGEIAAVALAGWALIRVFFWWRDIRLSGGGALVTALISIAGAALVTTTAYYGGQLVYDLGVNVLKTTAGG